MGRHAAYQHGLFLAATFLSGVVSLGSTSALADEAEDIDVLPPRAAPRWEVSKHPPRVERLRPKPEPRSDDRFYVYSSRDVRLRVGGYAQVDARTFIADDKDKLIGQFVLRRARPIFDALLFKHFEVRLMPDFGLGKAVIQDAYVDINAFPWLRLLAGKAKVPLSLEQLQLDRSLALAERGLTTNLVPNRDVGVQIHGDIEGGTLSYSIGIFNGAPDNGNGDVGNSNGKDGMVRVFVKPFRLTPWKMLHEIGFGVAGSSGNHGGTTDNTQTPTFKTAGQNTMFAYRTGDTLDTTVIGHGLAQRVVPQAYAYVGPVGVLTEYVRSTQDLALGTKVGTVGFSSWQVVGTVVVTGENATYEGVRPRGALGMGGLGAIELAGRVGQLQVDNEAFRFKFADPTKSVRGADSWGVGFNYIVNRGVKIQADFDRTTFKGGDKDGDRPAENCLVGRIQVVL